MKKIHLDTQIFILGQEAVFHIVSYTVTRCISLTKSILVSLSESFPNTALRKLSFFRGLPVVHVCLCDTEIQYLAPIVDDYVKFEAVEPSHCGPAHLGRPLEYLISLDALLLQTLMGVESTNEIPVHLPGSRF